MQLSSFILTQRETILAEWENDARRRIAEMRNVSIDDLRDHLGELLDSVAHDIADGRPDEAPPTSDTSKRGDQPVDAVAEKHGARRAEQGMNVSQVVSEFPALRLCVTQLWLRSLHEPTLRDLETLRDFDRAIDRALTKSVNEFVGRLDQSRETLLGILGHDLRDPLSTVIAGGTLLARDGIDAAEAREVARRVVSTGQRMHHMVVDLLDAARTRFGGQMPIHRREVDLGETIRAIVAEFCTSHPERGIPVRVAGDLRGHWDDKRLGQVIENLLSNAGRYATPDTPILVTALAANDEITVAVHNDGPPIPPEQRPLLFEPWSNIDRDKKSALDAGHPGLGLYIANTIVGAHGGRIDVDSGEGRGTTFTIHLPRS